MTALSIIGFIDATFLTVKHFIGGPIPCAFLDGCDYVTTSKYAAIGHIPVALLGSLYYLAVTVLLLLYLDTEKRGFISIAGGLISAGFAMSLYFIFLQFFILRALCLYCLTSAAISTLLFIIIVTTLAKLRSNKSPLRL